MRQGIIASLLLFAAGLSAAAAVNLQSPVAQVSLLEVFSSEGCSSCPPADRWLSTLKDDPRLWRQVVPVTFHVDYWNYLGWPDRFATPDYSARQRRYAGSGAVRTVYTPGFVLNGSEYRGWFRHGELRLAPGAEVGRLALEVEDGRAQAVFQPQAATPPALDLHLAVLGFGLSTQVKAGENRGRTLNHDFVVLGYKKIPLQPQDGAFRGAAALPQPRFSAPRTAVAAWVTSAGELRPLQAVGGWLDPDH